MDAQRGRCGEDPLRDGEEEDRLGTREHTWMAGVHMRTRAMHVGL